jgi:hypothetical protein
MCEYEDFGLIITDVGEFYPKVFFLVRQITCKSLKEVKALLDDPSSIIITGCRTPLGRIAQDLGKVGAKTRMIIINDEVK